MTQYDNNMRGVLFKNKDKASDKHPDYKGQGEIDGKPIWVDAWIKSPKAGGDKFMSLSFKFKTPQQGGKPQTLVEQRPQDFDDSKDLPF